MQVSGQERVRCEIRNPFAGSSAVRRPQLHDSAPPVLHLTSRHMGGIQHAPSRLLVGRRPRVCLVQNALPGYGPADCKPARPDQCVPWDASTQFPASSGLSWPSLVVHCHFQTGRCTGHEGGPTGSGTARFCVDEGPTQGNLPQPL